MTDTVVDLILGSHGTQDHRTVSRLLPLIILGDFNLPDVCWEYNTTERKQSRRFLECMEDKFLMQLVREPNRECTPLDMLFAKRKGLLCDKKMGGHLGHSDPEIVVLSILTEVRRGISRTATFNFQRADLGVFAGDLLRESLGRQS